MKIYNVYQSGKRLYIDEKENPDNKIVVNKYDNMQQTLRLVSDGTLPPRLYWALRNPKLSNKYFILKLVNNEDLIVGTDISATPGLWDMLLIGTPDDYIIEGTDIDQSKLTYVSDHFGRLFVRDNFLEELDFEEQCSPTFRVFYDEIMFQLGEKADAKDIPDKMSDLENDTNFISGVALKDDGEGNVEIVGTTFVGGETEEGEIPSGGSVEVDDELDEESTNPVQNKVLTKEVNTLKEHNTQLKETIEKLQIKQTTDKAPFHHITDSANMKVLDFGMEGKTEQKNTEGKNLWANGDIEVTSGDNNGRGYKLVSLANPLPPGTYTISALVTSTDTDADYSLFGSFYNLKRGGTTRTSTTATFNDEITTIFVYAGSNQANSAGDTATFKDIQIELGSTATPYEPYTNGSSPNPDYPQEIKNAGVYNEETGRYEHKFGFVNKNHWDAEYASDINNWIKPRNYNTIPIFVGKGNTVTISFQQQLSGGLGIYFGISKDGYDNNLYDFMYHNSTIAKIKNNYTIVAENDYIYPCYYEPKNHDLFMQYIGNDLQIEISSSATDLVPHASQQFTLTSPVPLTKWDYLTKRDGVWGWSVYQLPLRVDETALIGIYLAYKGFKMQALPESMLRKDGYCNQMPVYLGADGESTCGLLLGVNDNWIYNIYNPYYDDTLSDYGMANFKAHLAEKPLEIITYSDTEQSFHPLPDEEQTLLNNLETYYGVTNLYNDQGCPTWLCYTCDSKLYVDQKLEQINNALLSLGANV